MDQLDFIGQTLDGKYHIERELGRGGMGTVYLATHLGTERPVAVKIIVPQFMQRVEFVERFRREARAAGRLRHPNVVNVTDFGFAETTEGQVAYLVMEYLDGCTLGEILDEEKNLPVAWSLDILEQVCSAVQEAHEMGIIHRDLKPDNIWLEPNQRGGYTVKVLDFGIAKLEENDVAVLNGGVYPHTSLATHVEPARITLSGLGHAETLAGDGSSTHISEATTIARTANLGTHVADGGTLQIEPLDLENKTAILSDDGDASVDQDTIGTRVESDAGKAEQELTTGKSLLDSPSTGGLTKVGAVLGTPLYMSPEQCRGEHLDPRSDIYSLGVIAYQMLSGDTPFSGDFKDVMESHKSVSPPPLRARNVRRKMRQAIMHALDKQPENRPQTAEGFASVMRSRSEGIFGLLRRALVIYSEHLPKFLMLTTFLSIPMMVLTIMLLAESFLKVGGEVSESAGTALIGMTGFLLSVASAFCTTLIVGTIGWMVTQYLSVPLRPVKMRPALKEARRKWKRVAGAGILTAILPFVAGGVGAVVGFVLFGVVLLAAYPITGSLAAAGIAGGIGATLFSIAGFLVTYVLWILVPTVVMLENVSVWQSFKRSQALVKRSFMTSGGAVFIMVLIPAIIAGSISFIVNVSGKAYDARTKTAVESIQKPSAAAADSDQPKVEPVSNNEPDIKFSLGRRNAELVSGEGLDMQTRIKHTILESLIQIFWLPMQIFVFSFSAIIVALLYLKTRLAGGESMNDLIERFEDDERPRKKWQERVRQRLIQSGRIPSKS